MPAWQERMLLMVAAVEPPAGCSCSSLAGDQSLVPALLLLLLLL